MVAQASESLEGRMISDKKLPKPVDELDSHFKTRHPAPPDEAKEERRNQGKRMIPMGITRLMN